MTKDDALTLALKAIEADGWCDMEVVTTAIKEALKQPSWISLTDEEKDSLLLPFGSYWIIDAIEAKLKEKNGV